MKKYKLKEECKKYFKTEYKSYSLDDEKSLALWGSLGLTIEALEEVEERIDTNVIIKDSISLEKQIVGHICAYEGWTEQEREDIEKFLNVFGSWEKMIDIINNDWLLESGLKLCDFLKEKGYDKQ